jgi:hypothetical protein
MLKPQRTRNPKRKELQSVRLSMHVDLQRRRAMRAAKKKKLPGGNVFDAQSKSLI